MKKLTIRQQANRIRLSLNDATPNEIKEGLAWYDNANLWAQSIAKEFGCSTKVVSELVSLLSPQVDWETNKRNVKLVLSGTTKSVFATGQQLKDCHNAINGWTIPEPCAPQWRRQKTHAFANQINNPSRDYVVIDRHAIRVCFGQTKLIDMTPKRYRDAVSAFDRIAMETHYTSSEVQAITWLVYKRQNNV